MDGLNETKSGGGGNIADQTDKVAREILMPEKTFKQVVHLKLGDIKAISDIFGVPQLAVCGGVL